MKKTCGFGNPIVTGFTFFMHPSFAVPVLQVHVEGGTAGDTAIAGRVDAQTWITTLSNFNLEVIVWEDSYTGPLDKMEELYLVAAVLKGARCSVDSSRAHGARRRTLYGVPQ